MYGAMSAEVRTLSGAMRATPSFTAATVAHEFTFGQVKHDSAHSPSSFTGAARAPPAGDGVHGCSVPTRKASSRRRTRSAISSTSCAVSSAMTLWLLPKPCYARARKVPPKRIAQTHEDLAPYLAHRAPRSGVGVRVG